MFKKMNSEVRENKSVFKEVDPSATDFKPDREHAEVSWNSFTQDTTLHGVRYIFQKGHRLRKILWCLVVLTAVMFFVVQVGIRIGVYFEYNTNVDVDVKFPTRIEFPSVTICNENHYRLTATVSQGLYSFVDTVFSSRGGNTDLTLFNVSDVNTVEFVKLSAHQKHDMIDRCTWNGEPCNMDENFETKLTNLGVCYTFNSPLEVTESGARSGLSLLLNVEQYEYMRGPQNVAGIKIHLHHPEETPVMSDQGFSVAPGSYTRVSIHRIQIESLPDPYGDCEEDDPVPVAECKLRCRSILIAEACSCRDVYMKPTLHDNGSTVALEICSLEKIFGCILIEEEKLSRKPASCSCAVPCKRVRFEPSLSYAQFSRQNIDTYIITDDKKRQGIEQKFHSAMEVAQRNVQEIVKRDTEQIEDLVTRMEKLSEMLNETYDVMQDFHLLAQRSKAANVITDDILKKDERHIEKFRSEIEADTVWPDVPPDYFWTLFSEMLAFAQEGNVSITEKFLRFCVETKDTTDAGFPVNISFGPEVNDSTNASGIDVASLEWVQISSSDQCDVFFANFLSRYNHGSKFTDPDPTGNYMLTKTLKAFTNRSHPFTEIETKCFVLMEKRLKLSTDFKTSIVLAQSILRSTDMQSALNYTETLLALYKPLYKLASQDYQELEDNLSNTCSWLEGLDNRETSSVRKDKEDILEVFSDALEIKDYFNSMRKTFNQMFNITSEHLIPVGNKVGEYLNGNVTKLNAAATIATDELVTVLDDMRDLNNELKNLVNDYEHGMTIGKRKLHHAYQNLSAMRIAYLNTYNVYQLELVKESGKINDSRMQHYVFNLRVDLAESLLTLINETYDRLTAPIVAMKNSITKPVDDLIVKWRKLHGDLHDYSVSTLINTDFFVNNFVQVDIFYEELSYERITQSPAFEFLSLLSEIGGFLGLLLGASVMTVCELVDYVTLASLDKLKVNRNTAAKNPN